MSSYQLEPMAASPPTQKTSRWLAVRPAAAIPAPGPDAPGPATRNGAWSPQDEPAAASHQVDWIPPSGCTQNTSRWFAPRLTAASPEPERADPGGAIPNGAWSPHP